MQVTRNGHEFHIALSGPIGETTPFFTHNFADAKLITVDMNGVTYINSIGVKNWILWTVRVPKGCEIKLVNCPLVIVSQASTVRGFTPLGMTIESFRLPYACDECGHEQTQLIARGTEYEYASGSTPAKINLVNELPCPKCSAGKLEPDVVMGKTFKFLEIVPTSA